MQNYSLPKFSIITITFNAESTLECTVLSVLGQTYPDVEHIVIDGKSDDGTVEIIRRYEDRISSWISEPDSGLYDAMNKGIHRATGDYLCFLNAGDTFHSETTLSDVAEQIKSKDELPDIVYGETAVVDTDRRFVRMRRLQAPEKLTWKSFRQGMLVCHQSFYVKREIVTEYDLKYRFSSDIDWCIRALKKANVVHNTHLILTDYLEEGISTRNHRASLIERMKIMSCHYGWFSTLVMHIWFIIRAVIKK